MEQSRKCIVSLPDKKTILSFVELLKTYKSDVNIRCLRSNKYYDAKDEYAVFSLSNGERMVAEIVSDDEEEIEKFIEDMADYYD